MPRSVSEGRSSAVPVAVVWAWRLRAGAKAGCLGAGGGRRGLCCSWFFSMQNFHFLDKSLLASITHLSRVPHAFGESLCGPSSTPSPLLCDPLHKATGTPPTGRAGGGGASRGASWDMQSSGRAQPHRRAGREGQGRELPSLQPGSCTGAIVAPGSLAGAGAP